MRNIVLTGFLRACSVNALGMEHLIRSTISCSFTTLTLAQINEDDILCMLLLKK